MSARPGRRGRLGDWVRRHLPVAAIAVTVGTAGGALIYYASLLSGLRLFLLAGGVGGVLVATVLRWFSSSTAVSEVEVTVPQLSRVTFAVTKDHKVMARRIVVQMASRVAVQPLQDGAGRADEALSSLYQLFTFVRDLLDEDATSKVTPGRPKVDVLALNMLNCHLRPFLSTWHRRYEEWRATDQDGPESAWPDDAKFRHELEQLQHALHPIAVAFAEMAGFADYVEVIGLGHATPAPSTAVNGG